jgi:hypothetical protein
MKQKEEHHKISAAYRPTQEAKRAQAKQKQAVKRVKTEPAGDVNVSGKQEIKCSQDSVKADIVMGEG